MSMLSEPLQASQLSQFCEIFQEWSSLPHDDWHSETPRSMKSCILFLAKSWNLVIKVFMNPVHLFWRKWLKFEHTKVLEKRYFIPVNILEFCHEMGLWTQHICPGWNSDTTVLLMPSFIPGTVLILCDTGCIHTLYICVRWFWPQERRKSRDGQKQNLVLLESHEESWLRQLEEKQGFIDELNRKVRVSRLVARPSNLTAC